jgi:isopentenyl-diphosphate delta-isomerase type 1
MDELFDIVTEDDIVTHQAPRTEAHARGLWHRGVHVFLFDNGGRLLVQKRSADRKQYPSLLDCSVSEHVKSGESYPDAARRGLMEELGVAEIGLQFLVKFKMVYGLNDNEISMVYQGVIDPAAVKFDPVEIDSIQYIGPDELKKMMNENRADFCGWFVEIMNWTWGKPCALTVL